MCVGRGSCPPDQIFDTHRFLDDVRFTPWQDRSDAALKDRQSARFTDQEFRIEGENVLQELRGSFDPGQMALLGADRNPNVALHRDFVSQDPLQTGNALAPEVRQKRIA